MMRRSEPNGRSAGRAGGGISGNRFWRLFSRGPMHGRWRVCARARETGYEGGKTALYALVASLRPKSAKPLVRFEGLPGEFSQHDFGQIEVEFVDGSSRRIHFFASRLKYSRLIRVSLVQDEAVESLVRTLAEHLASWGGLPLRCVFDRPKTIALQWKKNGEVTEWNSIFAYATLEMGVGVELCWPYRAQQKGSVENLESCRRLKTPVRGYLAAILPGLADLSIQHLSKLTP